MRGAQVVCGEQPRAGSRGQDAPGSPAYVVAQGVGGARRRRLRHPAGPPLFGKRRPVDVGRVVKARGVVASAGLDETPAAERLTLRRTALSGATGAPNLSGAINDLAGYTLADFPK